MLTVAADAPRPRVAVMTALPLFWGEGDPSELLRGQAGRAPALRRLDREFDLVAIDELTPAALQADALILAQPRLLAPTELVELDRWVRKGGRALILADAQLDWPSRYPLGDPRRPPPVTLLDPLFAHWKLVLEGGEDGTGRWQVPANCKLVQPEIADCRVGQGRAVLVADADLLHPDSAEYAQSGEWVSATLRDLTGRTANKLSWAPLFGGMGALIAALTLDRQREQKRKRAASP